MSLTNWFGLRKGQYGTARRRRAASRSRKPPFRPELEILEDRFTPSGFAGPPSLYSTGIDQAAMVAGDFDGDGDIDLAIAGFPSVTGGVDEVALLDNNGHGSFAPPRYFPTGTRAVVMVAADFDGDGDLDLAIGSDNQVLTVLTNDGTGSFGPPRSFSADRSTQMMEAGDFDRDGDLDIAIGQYNAADISLMTNVGAGSFLSNHVPFDTFTRVVAMVAGDFDRDGDLDLVVAGTGPTSATEFKPVVTFLPNIGSGLFGLPSFSPAGPDNFIASGMVAGDFDGDLNLDVAVLFAGGGDSANFVIVLTNDGAGSFASPRTFSTGIATLDMVAGDFDNDGDLDLALAGYTFTDFHGVVSLLSNNGDGTFASPNLYSTDLGPLDVLMVAADLDGDGDLDLAIAGYADPDAQRVVSVLINRGKHH